MTDLPHDDPTRRPVGAVDTTSMPPTTPMATTPTPATTAGTSTSEEPPRTRDVAAEEAAGVAHEATAAAGDVAGTAKDEAAALASEAKDHARRMYLETKDQLASQASTQQSRAASGLSSLGAELRQMAERSDGGTAADLARQGAERAEAAAAWLGDREPGDVLDDLSRWARRRPGAFLAAAAALGLVAGRMTRGLAEDARDDDGSVESRNRGLGAGQPTSAAAVSDPYVTGAHPRATDDLPAAVGPDDSFVVSSERVTERGTP
jgi:hypothetical protein